MNYWYKYNAVEKFLREKGLSHDEVVDKLVNDHRLGMTSGMIVIPKDVIPEIMGTHTTEFMEKLLPEHPSQGFSPAVSVL